MACTNFFHLIFPCANIFFVLRPPPPISLLMVRPLARVLQLSFTLIPSRPTALEFYCQCSFDLFDCVTINSLLPNSLWSVVKCDRLARFSLSIIDLRIFLFLYLRYFFIFILFLSFFIFSVLICTGFMVIWHVHV